MTDRPESHDPQPFPLLTNDPPRIGDFWLDARLTARESGVVFLAHAEDQPAVMVIVLSDGAERDRIQSDGFAPFVVSRSRS